MSLIDTHKNRHPDDIAKDIEDKYNEKLVWLFDYDTGMHTAHFQGHPFNEKVFKPWCESDIVRNISGETSFVFPLKTYDIQTDDPEYFFCKVEAILIERAIFSAPKTLESCYPLKKSLLYADPATLKMHKDMTINDLFLKGKAREVSNAEALEITTDLRKQGMVAVARCIVDSAVPQPVLLI